jgi:uncharacterized protein YihD (DUF1040 family)
MGIEEVEVAEVATVEATEVATTASEEVIKEAAAEAATTKEEVEEVTTLIKEAAVDIMITTTITNKMKEATEVAEVAEEVTIKNLALKAEEATEEEVITTIRKSYEHDFLPLP